MILIWRKRKMAELRQSLAELCPNMPEKKREKFSKASGWGWKTHGDINEGDLLDRKLKECIGYYYSTNMPRGKTILELFNYYRPVIEAWVKEFTYNEDKVNGSFKGDLATGASETTIRPLIPESFAHAQYTQRRVAGAGVMNLIPDDTQAASSVETATKNEKTWLILGYCEFIAGVPIVTILQEYINDSEGLRNPLYVYPQQALTDLLLVERASALWIETGKQLDIDYYVRNDTVTGFFPVGLECLVETQITDISLR